MSLLHRFLFFLLLSCFSFLSHAQSPWVENKGSFYTAFTATSISYTNIFDNDGNSAENTFETNDRTYSLYGSYSLSDKTAVVVDYTRRRLTYWL